MPDRRCLRAMTSCSQLSWRHLRAVRRMLAVLFVVRCRDVAYMIRSVVSQLIKVMKRCAPWRSGG